MSVVVAMFPLLHVHITSASVSVAVRLVYFFVNIFYYGCLCILWYVELFPVARSCAFGWIHKRIARI